ncbi:MAG TPA: ester cyclase, partial [Angustibacter sp.]|nr:ester cyclase [Angustibacter sp.]
RGSLGDVTRGRDEWRRYRDTVRAGSSDFRNEVLTLVVERDAAAARLRYTGTHDGPLAGVAPTGRRFTYEGAAFFVARDGRLAGAWVLGDLALGQGPRERLPLAAVQQRRHVRLALGEHLHRPGQPLGLARQQSRLHRPTALGQRRDVAGTHNGCGGSQGGDLHAHHPRRDHRQP